MKSEMEKFGDVVDAEILDESIVPATVTPHSEHQREFIAGLREIADFYEAHPELPENGGVAIDIWPTGGVDKVGMYARIFGKSSKRVIGDSYFILGKKFRGGSKIEVNWSRGAVCQRVVVGQETVVEDVVEIVGKRTVTKDKVEWKCPSVLAPKEVSGGTAVMESSDEGIPF